MATVRTMAWATLAAAVAWAPWPVAGQQPAATPTTPVATYPPGGTTSAAGEASPFSGYQALGQTLPVGSRDRATQDQIAKLAQQYVKATQAAEKSDIRKKLADALGKQFDQLAERQQKELEALEKQVADLRALLKKRHDARDQIIDRRLDQVLQEAEGLGWGTRSADPRSSFFPPSAKPAPERR